MKKDRKKCSRYSIQSGKNKTTYTVFLLFVFCVHDDRRCDIVCRWLQVSGCFRLMPNIFIVFSICKFIQRNSFSYFINDIEGIYNIFACEWKVCVCAARVVWTFFGLCYYYSTVCETISFIVINIIVNNLLIWHIYNYIDYNCVTGSFICMCCMRLLC